MQKVAIRHAFQDTVYAIRCSRNRAHHYAKKLFQLYWIEKQNDAKTYPVSRTLALA